MYRSWLLFHEENGCNNGIPGCASSQCRTCYADGEVVHFNSRARECQYVHLGDADRTSPCFLSSFPQYELGAVKTNGPCISGNSMTDDIEKESW